MIEVHVPKFVTGANLLSTWSNDANGVQFPVNIGTGPIPIDGTTSILKRTTFSQGKEDLHGENSVFHKKREGSITIVSKDIIEVDHHSVGSLGNRYYLVSTSTVRTLIGGTLMATPGGSSTKSWMSGKRHVHAFVGNNQNAYVVALMQEGAPGGAHTCVFARAVWNADFTRIAQVNAIPTRGAKVDDVSFSAFVSQCTGYANSALSVTPLFDNSLVSVLRKFSNPVSKESVRATLLRHSGDFKIPRDENKEIDYGKLAQNAITDMDAFSLNSLMYVQEMINIKSLLPPRKEIRNLRKLDVKAFANVYLWIRYGLSLSFRDTKLLVEKLPDFIKKSLEISNKKTRLRSRKTKTLHHDGLDWQISQGIKILLDTYPKSLGRVGAFMDTLYGLDAFPTLQNLWDMVPYSFCVDWVIPIGDMLNTIDTKGRQQAFNVYVCTLSYKGTSTMTLKHTVDTMSFGEVKNTFYSRTLRTSIPSLGVFDSVRNEDSGTGGPKRFFDATSLIVQRAL